MAVRAGRDVVRGSLAAAAVPDLQQPVYCRYRRDADVDADTQPQGRLLSRQLLPVADPPAFSAEQEPDAQRRLRTDRLEHGGGAVPDGRSGDAGAYAVPIHERRFSGCYPEQPAAEQGDQDARA